MPYQIMHEGVLREFEFYTPYGWPHWAERAFTEDGRDGLPLVVAMHGGAQNPTNFTLDWPFPLLINDVDNANWEDRFCVLYPYGFSYYPGLDGLPSRGWNTGFSGSYMPVQNDVGFIRAAIGAVETMMQAELTKIGSARRPFDPDRRFLFGYSMGGMLGYRLVSEMPNYWAALWAMSAAFGGRSHDGLTPTVTHVPQGHSSVSLFAHHGDADTLVPPGPNNDPSGLVISADIHWLYTQTGLTTGDADVYAASLRHLAAAALTYRTYNNCRSTAYQVLTGQPDVDPVADNATRYAYRRDDNAPNPEVIVYRDPAMQHTGFINSRYFDQTDVWDFFKTHPRVDL
jgi:poly(3-hydroxybutyrate) depolymerase